MKGKRNNGRWGLLILLAWTLTFVASCKDAFEDETYTAYEEAPIALYLKNHPDEYSLWVAILEKGDMYNTLNVNAVYTHFAPINAGVERYLDKMGLASVDEMTAEDAAYLVRYHLIPGVPVEFAQFQSGAINDLNATDDNLFVEFRDGGTDAIYLNGVSRFNAYDIKATNGLIHSVDDVLIPLVETVYDRLEEREAYSLFRELIDLTGFKEPLQTVYTETTDPLGNPIQQRFKYTAFVVSNETFAQEGIHSVQDLLEKLEAPQSGDYTSEEHPLHKYVGYHLLEQQRSFADLGQFPEGQFRMNMPTMAANELITVLEGGTDLVLNEDPETQEAIALVETNIACKNGVIHEVDDWMPVFIPEQLPVIWELTDYPDIEANVTQYRNASLGSQYNKTFTSTELTNITWSTQPEYMMDNAVIYRNSRGNEGIFYTDVLNHDHLRAELGESGWIEFKSPTIVRGKYKVSFVWPSTRYSDKTGIVSLILDNEMLRSNLTISNTRVDRVLTQDLGTVEFSETTSHTLRILSMDGKLITMDHVRFDPVE